MEKKNKSIKYDYTKAELEEMERKMNAKAHLETMFDDEKDEII